MLGVDDVTDAFRFLRWDERDCRDEGEQGDVEASHGVCIITPISPGCSPRGLKF